MGVFSYLRYWRQVRVLRRAGLTLDMNGVPNSYNEEAIRLNQYDRYVFEHSGEDAYTKFCDPNKVRREQFRLCLREKGRRIALQRYGVAQYEA